MTFEDWLLTQPYRDTTIKRSITDLRYAKQHFNQTHQVPRAAVASIRRYLRYLEEHPPAKPTPFDQALSGNITASRSFRPNRGGSELIAGEAPRGRAMVAKRIPEAEWQQLVSALEDDKRSREATVLLVIASLGLRIGDMLRMRRRDLVAANETGILKLEIKGGQTLEIPLGGVPEVWTRLTKQFRVGPDDNLASWVSEGVSDDPEAGAAAYKRCSRYLQAMGKRLGLSGRVHLHRLRRTVAVKALGLTRDVHAVQQLLGHRSLSSTLAYVDEIRKDEVEQLQQQLRGVRR